MPKFTVYRTQSPTLQKKNLKSSLKPVDAVKTPGFSLGLPQTTAVLYKKNDAGRYRIRTVLASRIERKVIRSAANTPDIEII